MLERIEQCLEKGVDVNSRDERGETALSHVKVLLRHGYFLLAFQVANMLLDHGADVDAEDYGHQTLLSHSVASVDHASDLTRLLLNHGADVWHGTDEEHPCQATQVCRADTPFGSFLQAIVRRRCVDGALVTADLLGRMMGSRPELMRSLVLRSMVRHGRYIRILGPVFLKLKSLLSPYWRQPPRLQYAAWKVIRKSIRPLRLVQELQQLGLPPALNRFITLDD